MNAQTATSPDAPLPMPTPPLAAEERPHTWTERWLGRPAAPTWAGEAQRLLLGAALAAAFGAALGLRHGGLSLGVGALGAPAGILAVAAVAVPAFAIVLALANAPLEGMDLLHATSRAAMRAGLFLAGLAPAVAMLVVTVEESVTVDVIGFGGLLLAGAIAARAFVAELRPALADAPRNTRAILMFALPAFLLFAALLAARVWWLALPMLTEAS
ncbi:MAG TPA: hypothetical protein VGL81_12660 [Polyangiaceae bacterium]